MHIAPVLLVLSVPAPMFGKTNSAGESDSSIHHQNASVTTSIGPVHSQRMRRMIIAELAAGAFHHPHIAIVQTPARTDTVEHHPHFYTCPRALSQCFAKGAADFIRINDISLEVDGLFRGANCLEHGREIFVAVLQHFDGIAFDRYWIGQGERRAEEFRIAYGKSLLEMIFQRVPADEENAEQRNDCAECQD